MRNGRRNNKTLGSRQCLVGWSLLRDLTTDFEAARIGRGMDVDICRRGGAARASVSVALPSGDPRTGQEPQRLRLVASGGRRRPSGPNKFQVSFLRRHRYDRPSHGIGGHFGCAVPFKFSADAETIAAAAGWRVFVAFIVLSCIVLSWCNNKSICNLFPAAGAPPAQSRRPPPWWCIRPFRSHPERNTVGSPDPLDGIGRGSRPTPNALAGFQGTK